MPKARHVMELQGRTRVVVENGKVVEVGAPMTEYCPIFDKVRGIPLLTLPQILPAGSAAG